MFNPGDKIKCIYPNSQLVKDKIYTFIKYADGYNTELLYVEGHVPCFYSNRFVLVSELVKKEIKSEKKLANGWGF